MKMNRKKAYLPFLCAALVICGALVALMPSLVRADSIVVENADSVSTENATSSSDLSSAASQVKPRVSVEYCGSMSEPTLYSSDALRQAASSVTPRIAVEYATSFSEVGMSASQGLTDSASAVTPRIVVGSATSLVNSDLVPLPLLPEPTGVTIEPASFTVESGKSMALTAVLQDFNGNLMTGRTIGWSAASGTVAPSSGTTDAEGQATCTYTAPLVCTDNSVIITASFAGDESYRMASADSSGTLIQLLVTCTMAVDPSSFSTEAGENLTITATLKAGGDPLPGKTIAWQCSSGQTSPSSGVTNSLGEVTTTYTAPLVSENASVSVSASFPGDSVYQSCQESSSGSISPRLLVTSTMTVNPPSFSTEGGRSLTIKATLKAGSDPLSGKTVAWQCSSGQTSPSSGVTNSLGEVATTYTAPRVSENAAVSVTASFAGDSVYQSCQESSSGSVSPRPPVPFDSTPWLYAGASVLGLGMIFGTYKGVGYVGKRRRLQQERDRAAQAEAERAYEAEKAETVASIGKEKDEIVEIIDEATKDTQ